MNHLEPNLHHVVFVGQNVKTSACRGYLREQDVESDLPMLPDGVNGSDSHRVGGAGGVGGEDQEVAAVHALGFDNRKVRVGWYRVLQLVSAPLLADAEPHPLVLPDCHCLKFCNVFKSQLPLAEAGMRSR